MTKLIYGLAVGNAAFDGLLIIPNALMWHQYHGWVSLAAMGWCGALGIAGLVAAPFAVRWAKAG